MRNPKRDHLWRLWTCTDLGLKDMVGRDLGACWPWPGYVREADGYGSFAGFLAHRYAWEYYVGPIPEGLTIDHLCGRRDCFNPYHLEPVTRAENSRRSWDSSPVRTRGIDLLDALPPRDGYGFYKF